MWFLVRDNSWHGDGHFLLCPYEANGEHAAAAAKSLQSCLTLCDPIDRSSPGSSVPEILQTRILEWVAISFSNHYIRSVIKAQVNDKPRLPTMEEALPGLHYPYSVYK